MNKKDATKWGKALISGKYKQCTGALMEEKEGGKSYCCLGVATKILKPKDYVNSLICDGDANLLYDVGIFKNSLPPSFVGGDRFDTLNDSRGESFLDIGTFVLLGAESGICEGW